MSTSAKPASPRRSAAWSRTSPCAHGQALIPVASTPTSAARRRARGGGDPEERDELLRPEPGDRRRALDRVARRDPDLGAQRVLARDDVARDVLGEPLDEQHLADHELVDRLLEELREARHVHALLGGIEVDEAVDLGRDERVAAAVLHAHGLLDTGHARAGEPELHVGDGRLEIRRRGYSPLHPAKRSTP